MLRQRIHRDHLRANVGVVDPATGSRLGHLTDLSPSGLGVSGRGEQPSPVLDTLRLELPMRVHQRSSLELSVEQRWVEPAGGDHWHAGFRIRAIDDADLEVLDHLMTWYGDS